MIDAYLEKAGKFEANGHAPVHNPDKGGPVIHLKKITAIELTVTPETSERYGFLEKKKAPDFDY